MRIERIFLILSFSLGGCATGPTFSGESVASPRLKSDAMGIVDAVVLGKSNCRKVDSVSTSVLGIEGEIEGDSAGNMTKGVTKERWIASACGKSFSFLVTFTPDGEGGSYIALKVEP